MGIISLKQVDNLYWLGRYAERVYATLKIFSDSFDKMIDSPEMIYDKYCEVLDIPNIYESKEDFLERYPFDLTVNDSIISNLNRAYDNAIVLRETIGSEALSYIQLCVYEMTNAHASDAPLIEIQQIMDDILAFWGIIDDQVDDEQARNILKAGKRIERIDLYARLEIDKKTLEKEVQRMIPRVLKSGMRYNEKSLNNIKALMNDPKLNYEEILTSVESIIL